MKKRILVVDDEIDFLQILKRVFEASGEYHVRTCNLASQVLYVARDFKPDMILLDCMMPGMDGGEVAALLQADPQLKDTPFAFLTCTVSEPELVPSRCYTGVRQYLPKTMELSKLAEHIERFLSQRTADGGGEGERRSEGEQGASSGPSPKPEPWRAVAS